MGSLPSPDNLETDFYESYMVVVWPLRDPRHLYTSVYKLAAAWNRIWG